PTIASGSLERVFMYWAAPCATRRTLPNVKSSAITPRQPSVPNLIGEVRVIRSRVTVGVPAKSRTSYGELQVTDLARPLENLDDLAHILCPRARNHEHGVFGVDDDHVLHPNRSDQPPVA